MEAKAFLALSRQAFLPGHVNSWTKLYSLKKTFFPVVIIVIFMLFTACVQAAPPSSPPPGPSSAPASPDITEAHQPNGIVIKVYLKGDERISWVETEEGYTIAQDEKGYWRYVQRYIGKKPVLSEIPAEKAPPEGLRKNIRPAPTK